VRDGEVREGVILEIATGQVSAGSLGARGRKKKAEEKEGDAS